MNFITSIGTSLMIFLAVFIPTRIIIIVLNLRFHLFMPLQLLIERSGKQKLINNLFCIISIPLFVFINEYTNFNDYQSGIVLGIWFGVILTISESKKDSKNNI